MYKRQGVGIAKDLQEYRDFLLELELDGSEGSGEFVEFRPAVELATLAALAGYKFDYTGLWAFSHLFLGSPMNKNVSGGDGNWGTRCNDTAESLQLYCLGDLKVGHICYALLFHTLLSNLFPDPDIVVAATTGHSQAAVLKFFRKWICTALGDKEIRPDLIPTAKTREELASFITPVRDEEKQPALDSLYGFEKFLPTWPPYSSILSSRIYSRIQT